MRVVVATARSSPGVTTTVLALASVWPGRVLLMEAGEDGGALQARFGLNPEPGAATLAAALRHQPDGETVWSHTQALPGTDGRLLAVVAPPAAEAARMLLHTAADRLARVLARVSDAAMLIDAGRLPPSPAAAPLIAEADCLLLVARPRVEELQALAHRLPVVGELGPRPHLVLVGEQPYGPREVETTLGIPVVGALAEDPAAARALEGHLPTRGLDRSRLLRTATTLHQRLAASPTPDADEVPEPMPARPAWAFLARLPDTGRSP